MAKPALLHRSYPIGLVVTTAKTVISAKAGSLGVVYEHYSFGEHEGISVIFANGDYDGFSCQDTAVFDLTPVRIEKHLADYKFKTVGSLMKDYREGYFKRGFEKSEIN
jgi:hypothetical protein